MEWALYPKRTLIAPFSKTPSISKYLAQRKGIIGTWYLYMYIYIYRLKIPILNAEINPAKSKIRVKSNSITIALWKKESGQWSDLKEKKSPVSAIYLIFHRLEKHRRRGLIKKILRHL